MPTFSFSSVSKKNDKTSNNIIDKNKLGVISITLKGNYKVIVDDIEYDINPKCYSCKNVKTIYSICYGNAKVVKYIRWGSEECNRLYWTPFRHGFLVKGDIIKSKLFNKVFFDIKKIIEDDNSVKYIAVNKFFNDNYAEISKNIINNRLREI